MTRADQRQVLEAFSRDCTRELHNLLAADLGRIPQFVFQQLYNRLQWHIIEGEAAERTADEAARRAAPGRLSGDPLGRFALGDPPLHAIEKLLEDELRGAAEVGHQEIVQLAGVVAGERLEDGPLLSDDRGRHEASGRSTLPGRADFTTSDLGRVQRSG